jgi:hypothetical protein
VTVALEKAFVALVIAARGGGRRRGELRGQTEFLDAGHHRVLGVVDERVAAAHERLPGEGVQAEDIAKQRRAASGAVAAGHAHAGAQGAGLLDHDLGGRLHGLEPIAGGVAHEKAAGGARDPLVGGEAAVAVVVQPGRAERIEAGGVEGEAQRSGDDDREAAFGGDAQRRRGGRSGSGGIVAERECARGLRRALGDLEVHEQPAHRAVGPAREDVGLEWDRLAGGVEETEVRSLGQRTLRERHAGGDGPVRARDVGGFERESDLQGRHRERGQAEQGTGEQLSFHEGRDAR